MARALGWDIGGAHLKAALSEDDRVLKVWQMVTPIWRDFESLQSAVDRIDEEAGDVVSHVITMTGEVADVFPSRRTGVEQIARIMGERLSGDIRLYGGEAGFLSLGDARSNVFDIASANWHASATITAQRIEEALFIDMGSTTTDLVPVSDGKVRAKGHTDRDRLVSGELVYQGYTRTALMAVAREVPFIGRSIPVMNEFFATMADVQRVIGNLEEIDDLHEAADGTDKSIEGSRRRIARMVGMDAADARDGAWEWLAHAFAEAQVRAIHDAALKVLSHDEITDDAPLVVAGAGRPVLRRLAARLDRGVVDFSDLVDCASNVRDDIRRAAPASALSLLAAGR
ncbi:hydantoinase/oxoprolinase family protein [Fulvimarina sp. 2208YS6-2-32]|uniref:Hydantoinase/oxoprolinase family protein n=1 Tax=Fulvimarina uroteuthidis TaxID=3098149 RepID=A0ABU5HY95_9HYPH|nr:hydantoinase/oxoprolinase family protein [Fulvimarina sp. 2208YS6-2-32]MDY8108105.1 hydantoinase/oxoprolinase family protein [Fulvimarina sp. 2208YS6-2-32]